MAKERRKDLERILRSAWARQQTFIARGIKPEEISSMAKQTHRPLQDLRSAVVLVPAMAGVAVTLVLVLTAPRLGRILTVILLAALFLCELIISFKLTPSLRLRTLLLLFCIIATICFGFYVWPSLSRHVLSASERASFEEPLKAQKEPRYDLLIACPAYDEKTCAYAQQFVQYFGEAGWNPRSAVVHRITISKPQEGIILYLQGVGKVNPNNWNPLMWTRMDEGFFAVRQAFVNIEIEPESGADPNLSEGVIEVYFGVEKSDEGTRNDLTRLMEKIGKQHPPILCRVFGFGC